MSSDERSAEQVTQQLLDEAEALIWGLLDENIDSASLERLEAMLANEVVRKRYVQCVELHADLQQLFQEDNEQSSSSGKSPVLGSLSDLFPPPGLPAPGNPPQPPLAEQ